jgi:hypothetical protein
MNKKEKIDEKLTVMVQPTLMSKFRSKCKKEYKTVSSVLRDLMFEYINEENK